MSNDGPAGPGVGDDMTDGQTRTRVTGRDPVMVALIRRLGFDPKVTRRVIIDIPADNLVRCYVEAFGDGDAFSIVPPGLFDGVDKAVITTAGNGADIRRFMVMPDGVTVNDVTGHVTPPYPDEPDDAPDVDQDVIRPSPYRAGN